MSKLCTAVLLAFIASIHIHAAQYESDTIGVNAKELNQLDVQADVQSRTLKAEASQTISSSDFQVQGITDLAEALRRMAGTNVRDYGGAGGMKTLSVRSMGATHTGVVYDGLSVTDCESGQIDLSRFALEQIDNITLVAGGDAGIFLPARSMASAATLYLSSGAPDFSTKSWKLSTFVAAGSFGYVNPRLKYEQRLSRSWSLRLHANYTRSDNQYPFTLTNYTVVTREKRYNSNLKTGTAEVDLFYRPSSSRQLHIKAYYYDNRKELPGQVIYYNPVNNECQRFRNVFGQIHYNTILSSRLNFQASAKADAGITRYRDFGLQYENGVEREYYKQQEYYATASLLYTPLSGLSFSLSSDYALTMLRSDAIEILRPTRHTILESLAARYRRAGFTATATLIFSSYRNGAKDGEAARDAHRLSPSLAVAWTPKRFSPLSLRLSYKDIFRMPTFSDNYYAQMGSRDLLPEKTRQFNAGFTLATQHNHRFLDNASLSTDAYYNNVSDKIVAMPANMFYWNMVNVGKVDIIGIDIKTDATLHISRYFNLQVDGNYTFQYAVNVTDPTAKYYKNQIAYTPRHSGAFSLAILTPWVNLSFHGTAMTKRYATNQNMDITRIDGYHEFGLAAYRDIPLGNVNMSLRADLLNLTDEQYDIVRKYPMPGRSYKITLKLTV